MGRLDDFLQRLAQHVDAQKQRLDPTTQNPAAFVANAFLQPSRGALDTLGLGLEGTDILGQYLAGEAALPLAGAQVLAADNGLLEMNDEGVRRATDASRRALAQGPTHPRAALNELRNSGDTLTSYGAGALAMALDPANLVGAPVGKAAGAAKAAKLEALAGRTAELSPEFEAAAKSGAIEELLRKMQPGVVPGEAATGLTNDVLFNVPKDLEGVSAKVQALVDRDRALKGLGRAEGDVQGAGTLYKDVQAQKAAAVRDLFTGVRGPSGRLPRGFKDTPEYAGQVDEAKNAVELLNPRGPQGRATFNEFVGGRKERLAQMQARADQAHSEFQAAFAGTAEQFPATDTPAVQRAIAEGVAPDVARQRSAELGDVNARFNAMEQGTDVADAATLLPDPEQTVTPAQAGGVKSPTGRARTVYEQLMADLGPTDDAAAFRKKDTAARAYLRSKGIDYHTSASEVQGLPVAFANGPVVAGDQVKYLLRGAQDPEFVPNAARLEALAPSPLPVAAKTADNPEYLASVRDQATAVANLEPPPSMYPELNDPKAGRMIDLINHALKEGLVAQQEAFSRPWKKMGLSDVASVWYGVNIQTVKNLLQDPAFARFVLANEDIAQKAMTDNRKVIVNRLVKGEKDPLSLFGTLGDVLVQLGLQTEKDDPKYAAAVMKKLGGNPFDNEAEIAQHLNGMQQALTGLGLQLTNPVRAVTGILTAPLNLLIPMRARMFHIINNVTHVSSRVAAFEQAAFPMLENSARMLLDRAAAEGKDVTPLLGRGLERGGDVLAQEGMFSWQEASKVLGNRYGKEWKAISEQAMDAGYENSRRVLGNYQLDGALGAAEQQIRKVVPLQSWAWRAYKSTGKYALQHPAISLGLLHLAQAAREEARQTGMPGYMVGTIGVKAGPDTPFLHLLADVFTPEQESEIRANPLSLFSPVGGDVLGMGLESNAPETGYQKAQQLLGATGASFSPLIQEGAYLTGQDYKAPAPGSRYSNIDLLTADLGGPQAPTIAGPNKKLRALVAPMFGASGADTFDPVVNKADELALERTKKPISDPSNLALALDVHNHGPFYQEAQRLLDEGGAARSAFNAASPVSVITRTETTANRQAAGDPPYPYDLVQQAKDQGLVETVKLMNAANDQWYKAHPEAAVNKKADLPKEATADPRLLAFERENAVLKRYAPRAYATALADYRKTLGIK